MRETKLLVIDTETTGLDPQTDCIIELAACSVVIDTDKLIFNGPMFATRVLPSCPVPENVAAINGYSGKEWENAPPMSEVGQQFIRWIYEKLSGDGWIWTGSNVGGFDLPFLRADLARCCMSLPTKPKFERRVLNTESLCFPLLATGKVDSLGIASLRKWAGESGDQAHRATADVADTIHVISTYLQTHFGFAQRVSYICDECEEPISDGELLPEVNSQRTWRAARPFRVSLIRGDSYFDLCKNCYQKVEQALPRCVKLLAKKLSR